VRVMPAGGPTAAIATIAPGVQAQGLWAGRRQLFVRFAAEAETATLFRPEKLARKLEATLAHLAVHSVAFAGCEPLANAAFLGATLEHWSGARPVMLDCDVPHPEAAAALARALSLLQVTLNGTEEPPVIERTLETLASAARAGCEHALVLAPRESPRDERLLQLVEQAHGVSAGTKIVVHPHSGADHPSLDRRYATLLEQATAIHADVRLALRVPPPLGTR
jgi:hypothetical protein